VDPRGTFRENLEFICPFFLYAEREAPETAMSHVPSGRPEPGEYAAYMAQAIERIPGDDILAQLESQSEGTVEVF
jgi:hypothetical protein